MYINAIYIIYFNRTLCGNEPFRRSSDDGERKRASDTAGYRESEKQREGEREWKTKECDTLYVYRRNLCETNHIFIYR